MPETEKKGKSSKLLATLKDMTTLLGIIATVVTLYIGVDEHRLQGTQSRAEHFLSIRHQFRDSESFRQITEWITNNDDTLRNLSPEKKANYAGFFEELALLVNSEQVRIEVVSYTFGFYAIQCWESKKFWHGLEQDGWVLLKDFVHQMKQAKQTMQYRRDEFRF